VHFELPASLPPPLEELPVPLEVVLPVDVPLAVPVDVPAEPLLPVVELPVAVPPLLVAPEAPPDEAPPPDEALPDDAPLPDDEAPPPDDALPEALPVETPLAVEVPDEADDVAPTSELFPAGPPHACTRIVNVAGTQRVRSRMEPKVARRLPRQSEIVRVRRSRDASWQGGLDAPVRSIGCEL
jgi:hypothetical protein